MIQRNSNMVKLKSGYLFPEINLRKRQFLAKHPGAQLISLGIGDTTEPISPSVIQSLVEISNSLGTLEGYVGYGPEQGMDPLRKKIAEIIYKDRVAPEEIFISDGAKCDIGRLQVMFGSDVSIAIQDPAYPVYVDGSIIQGVREIHMMRCCSENGFFPDLNILLPVDLIYFCSPNNPTGAVSSYSQLAELIAFARKNRSIIIFDSAYAAYIKDPRLPKSIFELDGAKEVAIEIGSFSKLAGFTGVRLGWTVIPEALKYENGLSVRSDWNRITTTLFNGASIIAQHGGLSVLNDPGMEKTVDFYLENARLIQTAFTTMGYEVFGGTNAPYLWVRFPGEKSWDVFQKLMEQAHIIATPGSGFGPAGEGFVRFSAYGKRENILCAIDRLKNVISRGSYAIH
jgi:LL-diaminopimelate aminotransferase